MNGTESSASIPNTRVRINREAAAATSRSSHLECQGVYRSRVKGHDELSDDADAPTWSPACGGAERLRYGRGWTTVNVWPAMVIVPVRSLSSMFSDTL